MASRKCILDLLVPGCGNPFDISQCEWLLDVLPLRTVHSCLGLDWKSVDSICRKWLAIRDVMTPLPCDGTGQCRTNFPMMYNRFRSSLLQHYVLYALETTCGCAIAGSYPAARFLKRQTGYVSWVPRDINVWVHAGRYMKDVLMCCVAVLESAGVPWTFTYNLDYHCEQDTVGKPLPDIHLNVFASSVASCGDTDVVLTEDARQFWRLANTVITNAELFWRLVYAELRRRKLIPNLSGCNLHTCGQQPQHKILRSHMVRVKTNERRDWYRHVLDFVIIQVSAADELQPLHPVHTQFDLSCCSVAMRLSNQLIPCFSFYSDSDRHLLNGTMALLPCSFSSSPNTVWLQLLRLSKWKHRGFRLASLEGRP